MQQRPNNKRIMKKNKEKKNIDLTATAFQRTLQKASIRLLTKSGSQKLNVVGTTLLRREHWPLGFPSGKNCQATSQEAQGTVPLLERCICTKRGLRNETGMKPAALRNCLGWYRLC